MSACASRQRSDYAVRALLELTAEPEGPGQGRADRQAQEIPLKFLENILIDLRHAGSSAPSGARTAATGWRGPPSEITIGEVIRAVEGPLASVRGEPPEDVDYHGAAEPLRTVWIAVRASLRSVVDELTLADVAADKMPARIRRLTEQPDAWSRR